MSKKFHIFNFWDDSSDELVEIMNNKTCKKILKYLKKKGGSETDVSKDLTIPISTVHYNIQKLIKSKLIKIKDFYWSEKGNKVYVYESTDNVFVFAQNKSEDVRKQIMKLFSIFVISLVAISYGFYSQSQDVESGEIRKFESDRELLEMFKSSNLKNTDLGVFGNFIRGTNKVFLNAFYGKKRGSWSGNPFGPRISGSFGSSANVVDMSSQNIENINKLFSDYSQTNNQVDGVDEGDIIKTDGKYVYSLVDGELIISLAYPVEDAEILSTTNLEEFKFHSLFVEENRLLVFGSISYDFNKNEYGEWIDDGGSLRTVAVRLYDVSDREKPSLIRSIDFEGNYLASRKIGDYVYFVSNSNAVYDADVSCPDFVPQYSDNGDDLYLDKEKIGPISECEDISYIDSGLANNFLTLASISILNETEEIGKEVVVGSGNNVYVSLNNVYITQSFRGEDRTSLIKFSLDKGKINLNSEGEIPGEILNQFSMDEYEENFRVATTFNRLNNVYVLDEELKIVGRLEGLAEGEKIYSVRFMGDRGYVVTFRKMDPLFVIDLSDSSSPKVLGKLKIPGYSDYLHLYDENHIIGIGKDTNDGFYQGVKMAIFDVSDVSNPQELDKVIIGDRGTDSEVLRDHKAFLFDRERNLLVLPIKLYEKDVVDGNVRRGGSFVFQGAYVYDISLEDGFDIRGRVTHLDEGSFDDDFFITRSFYIDDVLYTFSDGQLQLNDLDDLELRKVLKF